MVSPAEWRSRGRTHRHRDHAIFFVEQGRADADTALVLIHGFPTASWDWHKVWEPLGRHFPRVIALDMIGFGFSAKPAAYAYSILDQADLHELLLQQLGVTRAHLLAHDYGDTVAQELLARHVERHEGRELAGPHARTGGPRIESCAFLNGGLFPEVHRPRLIQKLLMTPLGPLLGRLTNRRSFYRSFAAIFGPDTQPSVEELEAFWSLIEYNEGPRILHRLIRYIRERRDHRERWVGAMRSTRVPMRFINGPLDPVSGAHMVDRYRQLVPHPDTVILPGIGHYPQTEDPEGVLRAFLELHERSPA